MAHQKNKTLEKMEALQEKIAQAEKEEEKLQKEVQALAEAELDCWTELIAQAEKEEEKLQKEVDELAEAELDCWTELIAQAEREEERLQKEVDELAEAALDCWTEQIAQAEREEEELQKEVQALERAEKECWEKEGIGRRPDAEPTGLPKPKLTVREPISPPKPKLIAHESTVERIGPPKPTFPERIGSSLAKVGWKEILIPIVVTITVIIGAERVWKHIKQPPSVVTPAREGEGELVKLVTVEPTEELIGEEPTVEPTEEPIEEPTVEPTEEPIEEPTVEPTEEVRPPCVPDAAFVADVTVPDGTIFGPGDCFDKIWRLRNSGGCIWEVGYTLTFISGDQMGAPDAQPVPLTMPGDTTDISATMCAPEEPGTYRSGWRMRDASGQIFGPDVYVEIVVPDPALAKKNVEEAIDLFERGKSLLEMHDKTGEGDCGEAILNLQTAIDKATEALKLKENDPKACLCGAKSRIVLGGPYLKDAIPLLECAVEGLEEGNDKDEAKRELEKLRQSLAEPPTVVMRAPTCAEDWTADNKPTNPGDTFLGCQTVVWCRVPVEGGSGQIALMQWYEGDQLSCQLHTDPIRETWTWIGSGYTTDPDELCLPPNTYHMEVWIGPFKMAEVGFKILDQAVAPPTSAPE